MAATVEEQEEATDDSERQIRRRRRGLLRMYYGVDDHSSSSAPENPLDIDGSGFKPDHFMDKLLKEASLGQLFEMEKKLKKETQELDSNMQYLVYENHSKFITASETIKEMKDDFQRLEDDMGHLNSRVVEIQESSNSINSALADRKQQINKFSSVHHLLKKLQFLFELPSRLHTCIKMQAYGQAVRYYSKAQSVLAHYQHMPSFLGIQQDCNKIIAELKVILKKRLDDHESSPTVIAESVDLLLILNEPPHKLCQQFLDNSQRQLQNDLAKIEAATQKQDETQGEASMAMDALDFVSLVCNSFLGNMSLVIQSCYDMFVARQKQNSDRDAVAMSQQTLVDFVKRLMSQCLVIVRKKLLAEAPLLNSGLLARALDKLSGKLQTLDRLLPATGVSRDSWELVTEVMKTHTESHASFLRQRFNDSLMDVRQALAMFKGASMMSTAPPLNDHCSQLYTTMRTQLENSATSLQEFIGTNVSFTCRGDFRKDFCLNSVRQSVVAAFLEHVLSTCKSYSQIPHQSTASASSSSSYPPALILTLSRFVHDLERSHISYLTSFADEKFPPLEVGRNPPSSITGLVSEGKNVAELLLNHYVRVQGQVLSQMIRKSLETRDWLHTMEPHNVRSVMKRMVEEVTMIDKQVGLLFEEGIKKSEGSETSRTFTYSFTRGKGGYPYSSSGGNMDSSLLSNIQKLFYERIEVFATVEFNKLSIVTGIIKIALKALVECVRLRTFGKYGLQQIQVDAHYLQIYLWRYVTDEQLVRVLLDEVISSTIQRCSDPILMEQSVVELICEKS